MDIILSRYRYEQTMHSSSSRQLFKDDYKSIWVSLGEIEFFTHMFPKADFIWNRVIWEEGELSKYKYLEKNPHIKSINDNKGKGFCSHLREYESYVCSSKEEAIKAVKEVFKSSEMTVLKKKDSPQGKGVYFAASINEAKKILTSTYNENWIVEEFIKGSIVDGCPKSERVFITQGEILLNYNRVGVKNSLIANICGGGRYSDVHLMLTDKKLELIIEVQKELKRCGLRYAGVDFVCDFLTEVNISCPVLPYIPELNINLIPDLIKIIHNDT